MKSFLKLTLATAALAFCMTVPAHAVQGGRDDYVSGEINVVLKSGVSIETVNALYGTTVIKQIPGTSYYRLLTPGGRDAFETKADMAGDDHLVAADPNFIFEEPESRQASEAFVDQSSDAFVDGSKPASFFAQPSITNL